MKNKTKIILSTLIAFVVTAGIASAKQLPCESGTYQNETGQSACKVCAPGSYSVKKSTDKSGPVNCLPCIAGFYCPEEGMKVGNKADYKCQVGTYCDEGSSAPTPCPDGTSSAAGAKNKDGCTTSACAAGYYCKDGEKIKCDAGYKCPVAGMSEPEICEAGTYSAAQAKTCTDCTAGYYCPADGTTSDTRVKCEAGSYCPVKSVEPTLCPAGKYQSAEGKSSCSTCATCSSNKNCLYCPEGSTTNTQKCPDGYYCPTPAEKIECPAGSYCSLGSKEPKKCAAGKTSPAKSNSAGQCADCAAGFYCPQAGTENPIACSAGSYCPAGAISEVDCPAGSYCPTPAEIKECEAGYFCTGGKVEREACPRRMTSEKGAKSMAECFPKIGLTDEEETEQPDVSAEAEEEVDTEEEAE